MSDLLAKIEVAIALALSETLDKSMRNRLVTAETAIRQARQMLKAGRSLSIAEFPTL